MYNIRYVSVRKPAMGLLIFTKLLCIDLYVNKSVYISMSSVSFVVWCFFPFEVIPYKCAAFNCKSGYTHNKECKDNITFLKFSLW